MTKFELQELDKKLAAAESYLAMLRLRLRPQLTGEYASVYLGEVELRHMATNCVRDVQAAVDALHTFGNRPVRGVQP